MSPDRTDIYRFRTGYLKFKSVLCDRNTGLMAYTVYYDDVRRFFETRSTVAVYVARIVDLPRIESIYGWQAADRLLLRGAEAFRAHAAEAWDRDAVTAQDGVYQGRFVAFVPGSESSPLEPGAVARAAAALGRSLTRAFAGPDFADMTPAVRIEAGGAVFQENPFVRFERQMVDAVRGALSPAAAEERTDEMTARALRTIIDDERVAVLFQPVVDLVRGGTVGYEALSRGPGGTELEAPAVLFSYGEQLGLAGELDRLCHRKACEAAAQLDGGMLLFLNSVPEALEGGLDGSLTGLLRATGRDPEQVVLEVAEHRLPARRESTVRALIELRRLGFGIALDNAGSGFSTLQLIDELRPSYMKIDPTLVRGIDRNLLQQEVARSLVTLAERLRCKVVAPGIESGAEAEAVRQCGVRLAQGNHLAPPRPAGRPPLAEPGPYGGVPGP